MKTFAHRFFTMKKWLYLGISALALYFLRGMLARLFLLLLISSTLAYLLCPIAAFLERKARFSPRAAALCVFALLGCVLAVTLYLGIPALGRQLHSLSALLPNVIGFCRESVESLSKRAVAWGFSEVIVSNLLAQAGEILNSLAAKAGAGASAFMGKMTDKSDLLLSPVVAFFLIKDRRALSSAALRCVPLSIRRGAMQVFLSVEKALSSYVRGQVLVSLATGLMTAAGLLCIQMPFALILGLLMAVFDLIPYFGPWIGAVPIVLLALPEGTKTVLPAVLVVFIAQQAEALVLSPNILGDAAALHPCVVLLSLLCGSFLWGILGMLYAIPLLLILRAVFDALLSERLKSAKEMKRTP